MIQTAPDLGHVTIDEAMHYAEHGYTVFPCIPHGKAPATPRGFHDATADRAKVERWLLQYPSANLAMPTAGLVVVDVDPDGQGWLAEHPDLAETMMQTTPRGGKHFVYRRPKGKAWTCTSGKLAPGVDVRTDGGYIVVAPSYVVDSKKGIDGGYAWDNGIVHRDELPEPPAWLVGVLDALHDKRETASAPPPRSTDHNGAERRAVAYLEAMPEAIEGQGGHAATYAAATALVHGFCLDPEPALRLLLAHYNPRCRPAWTEKELRHKVADAATKPHDRPRGWLLDQTPPERATTTPAAEAVEVGQSEEEDEPERRYEPFPVDALPAACRRFVQEAGASLGVDASFVALPLLAGLAGAVGNTRRARASNTWTAPAVVWTCIVGESGTLKSPALKLATAPIAKRQREAMKAHRRAMEAYKKELLVYKSDLKAWQKKHDEGEEPPAEPERPVCERLVVQDTTTEALADRLQDARRGVLLARDELSGWLASFNQYKGGKGGDEAHWLTMYDAGALLVDRKTGDKTTTFVPRAAVSITGGIQPGTLRRSLTAQYQESGLAARLLMAMPPRKPKRWTDTTLDRTTTERLEDVYTNLWRLEADDDDGTPRPIDLRLDPEAKEVFKGFVDDHGEQTFEHAGALASAFAKLEGLALRLALVIELARWAEGSFEANPTGPGAIGAESLWAAIDIVQWACLETERIYAMLRTSEEEEQVETALDIIRRKGGEVSLRDVYKNCGMNKKQTEAYLNGLAADGVGQWIEAPPGPKGGRPTKRFKLIEK